MLYIKKSIPPQSVTEIITGIKKSDEWHSLSDDNISEIRNCFNQIPKELLRPPLLKDQHYICAYCMRRIGDNGHTSIEHCVPLSRGKDFALDYNNFVCVCDGGKRSDSNGGRHVLCCDASKDNKELKMLNPFDKECMSTITYRKDGYMDFNAPTTWTKQQKQDMWDDINEVLHLNGIRKADGTILDTSTRLIEGRQNAHNEYEKYVIKLAKKGQLTTGAIDKAIRKIEEKEEWVEFAGVLLFFLRRKRKTLAGAAR